MNKQIIGLILVGIVSLSLIGCGEQQTYGTKTNNTDNFTVLSDDNLNQDDELIIVKEKSTGKRFIIFKGYRKGGITPLD
jgi:hypothetical protein